MSNFTNLISLINQHAASNIGYDQGERWSWLNERGWTINQGAEGDCSAVTIGLIYLAGYAIPRSNVNGRGTCYTGNIHDLLVAAGWRYTNVKGWSLAQLQATVKPGDVLNALAGHVIIMADNRMAYSMNIDENGRIAGGRAGDQTGGESSFRPLWLYRGQGWDGLYRAPDSPYDAPAPVATKPATPTKAKTSTVQRPVLSKGSRGDKVKALQAGLLRAFPLYAGPIKAAGGADGIFGASTEAVVKEFQRRSGLTADGVVGPATYSALSRAGVKL